MATDIRSLPAINDSAAIFRTWAQGVDAQLQACGLVPTADTGQADLTTFTPPTNAQAQTFTGFKMYRFNDALQATKPVFIKVEFGTGSTGARLALGITVGSATNGAGGFVGVSQSTNWRGGGSLNPAAASVRDSYCSGAQAGAGGGRIMIQTVFDPATQYSTGFVIERLKGGDGVAHASGTIFMGFLSGQASNQIRAQIMTPGSGPTGVDSQWSMLPFVTTGNTNTPSIGTDLALSPLMYALGVWLYGWPLAYRDADLTKLVPFTMDHLGAAHIFMPFGTTLSTFAPPWSASSAGMAFLWE